MTPQNLAKFKTVAHVTGLLGVSDEAGQPDVTSKTSRTTNVTLFIFYYYPKAQANMTPQNLAKFKTVAHVTGLLGVSDEACQPDVTSKTSRTTNVTLFIFYYYPK